MVRATDTELHLQKKTTLYVLISYFWATWRGKIDTNLPMENQVFSVDNGEGSEPPKIMNL